ncbi:MAG: YifB family Mg chelatase-like AAA ATPase [Eubacteriales bacterium]
MLSAVVHGLEVTIICVEMDVSNGLPSLQIVGSVSTEIREAGERVRTAIKNLGYQLPPKKVIGNLTPGNIRKGGVGFDLSIALAMLASYGILPADEIKEVLALGEIGLNGGLRQVNGVLPIVSFGKTQGILKYIVPIENAKEAAMIEGVEIYGARNLKEAVEHFLGKPLAEEAQNLFCELQKNTKNGTLDFSQIKGQEHAKRAVEIAVAGMHNLAMIGPPGAGKSMLAKRIPSIQIPLTMQESMEISRVYSIVGMLDSDKPFILERPFRNVHHTITKTALIGGGNIVKPGELSLAHGGVLFLDELPEFNKSVLEVLRQPLEDKKIRIIRNKGSYEFPANAMLVAAMNPCPCGNYPDMNRCTCTSFDINRYQNKISQPLLDRIDICVEVPRVDYEMLKSEKSPISSEKMRTNIILANERQQSRYKDCDITANSGIPSQEITKYCKLDASCESLMKMAYHKMDLTARTYYKVLKVARTIADLDEKDNIEETHIREAIGYRMIDKKYWRR